MSKGNDDNLKIKMRENDIKVLRALYKFMCESKNIKAITLKVGQFKMKSRVLVFIDEASNEENRAKLLQRQLKMLNR